MGEEARVQDETNVDVSEKDGGNKPESSTGSEANNTDGSSASQNKETVPFDQDPKWKKARAAEKALNDILESKGFDSIEEMIEQLEEGTQLAQELSGRDINDILAKAETLEKYEAYWAEQERLKKREGKSGEEIIKDLEDELRQVKQDKQTEADRIKQEQEYKKSIQFFETEVSNIITKQSSIPDEYKSFVTKFLGVENPMFDVDPSNKVEIRKTASALMKDINAFEQAVIERYKKGKTKAGEIPNVPPSTNDNPAPRSTDKPQIKNLEDARKHLHEKLARLGAEK